LGHIAALFVRHLISHPDPGTFHPEGERLLFRKALLWLIREDFAARKLRIEGYELTGIQVGVAALGVFVGGPVMGKVQKSDLNKQGSRG